MAQRAAHFDPPTTVHITHDPTLSLIDLYVDHFATIVADRIAEAIAQQKGIAPPPTALLLTADEAAAVLGVSRGTLNTWSRNGQVQRRQMGKRVRYERAELDYVIRHGLRPISEEA